MAVHAKLRICFACSQRLSKLSSYMGVYKRWYNARNVSSSSTDNYETVKGNIVSSFPQSVQPYLRLMRMDRPIGSWLLFWPCSWSIALAAETGEFPSLSMLATFGVGSVIMRGAGCTINDMWDRDYDRAVTRTASRPIANGMVSRLQALVFLSVQLSVGLAILLSLNAYSVILGAASVPLVVVYPLMKRFTHWPQAVLGLTFNWGALLGYSAVKGYCDWSVCLPLYAACVSWTLFYDTIYAYTKCVYCINNAAYQDRDDDVKIGLKSTAVLFEDRPKQWLTGFGVTTSSLLLLAGLSSSITWPYYLGLGVTSCHLAWQVYSVDISDRKDCLRKFRSNSQIGMIMLLSIVTAMLIK